MIIINYRYLCSVKINKHLRVVLLSRFYSISIFRIKRNMGREAEANRIDSPATRGSIRRNGSRRERGWRHGRCLLS